MNILESILDFSLPKQDYRTVLNTFVFNPTSSDIPDDLVLKILNYEGKFNIEVPIEDMPHSRPPDKMVQFIALQHLIKKTGDKYKDQLLKISCEDIQGVAENLLREYK